MESLRVGLTETGARDGRAVVGMSEGRGEEVVVGDRDGENDCFEGIKVVGLLVGEAVAGRLGGKVARRDEVGELEGSDVGERIGVREGRKVGKEVMLRGKTVM